MKIKYEKIFKVVLIALIILTLVFIFGNSLKSQEQSSEQSDGVKEWLSEMLPEESVISLFLINNVRKLAHFIEFGVLSAELTLYALLFTKKKSVFVARGFLLSFVSAFLDETIQVFTKRGPAIPDIWIDLFGAFSFMAGVVVLYLLFIYIINVRKNSREGAENGKN